jgi:hypothetical protein
MLEYCSKITFTVVCRVLHIVLLKASAYACLDRMA